MFRGDGHERKRCGWLHASKTERTCLPCVNWTDDALRTYLIFAPRQYSALTATGFFFSRYAMLVSPINYMLCSVNVALFGSRSA